MKISWKEDTFLGIYSESRNEIGEEYFKYLGPITKVIIAEAQFGFPARNLILESSVSKRNILFGFCDVHTSLHAPQGTSCTRSCQMAAEVVHPPCLFQFESLLGEVDLVIHLKKDEMETDSLNSA